MDKKVAKRADVNRSGNKSIWTRKMGKLVSFEHMLANGSNYIGEVDQDLLQYHGKGKYTYPDGACHDGMYRLGLRHGAGSYTFSSSDPLFGYRFIGEYINDEAHGHGQFKNVVTGSTYPCFYRHGVLMTTAPPALGKSLLGVAGEDASASESDSDASSNSSVRRLLSRPGTLSL